MSAPYLESARLRPRLISIGFNYLVIACWIATLTFLGFAIRPRLPEPPGEPDLLAIDGLVFAMTVLPTWVYLTVTEAGERHATFGKRAARLWVLTSDGLEPTVWRIALRNAVKLAPWQIAHLAVARFIVDADTPMAMTSYVASLALVAVTVLMAFRDPLRRGLHDRIAGTRVVSVLDSPALRDQLS